MNNIKFRLCYTDQNGKKSVDYNDDRYLIGLDGTIYENYGESFKNPTWEVPFDVAELPFLQQYIGVKDKNRKEIYEGDIVRVQRRYLRPYIDDKIEISYKTFEGDTEIGVIFRSTFDAKFMISYEHIRYDDFEDIFTGNLMEVLGNNFENPELLKKVVNNN